MFSPESEIFLWIKPKNEKKKTFFWKFGSLPTFRSTREGNKHFFFVMSLSLSDHMVSHNIASSTSFFFDFARVFSLFSLVFRTSNFRSLRNLIKQLFHEGTLDMRLVIANSALRTSLAIYHLMSNARSWNNCWVYKLLQSFTKGNTSERVFSAFAYLWHHAISRRPVAC